MHELVEEQLAVRDRDALADPAVVSERADLPARPDGIARIEYDSTETVLLYRSFLAAPGAYHRRLASDDA